MFGAREDETAESKNWFKERQRKRENTVGGKI